MDTTVFFFLYVPSGVCPGTSQPPLPLTSQCSDPCQALSWICILPWTREHLKLQTFSVSLQPLNNYGSRSGAVPGPSIVWGQCRKQASQSQEVPGLPTRYCPIAGFTIVTHPSLGTSAARGWLATHQLPTPCFQNVSVFSACPGPGSSPHCGATNPSLILASLFQNQPGYLD